MSPSFAQNYTKLTMPIIIPNSGCTGCISNADRFFIDNVERSDIFFVFTKIFSQRDLGLRMGKERNFLPIFEQ